MTSIMGRNSAEPKPFASLSSGLLARKGGAKPAMRPQAYQFADPAEPAIDDLGWNDMGDDHGHQLAVADAQEPVPSPVARQQEEIQQAFRQVAVEPAPVPEPEPALEPEPVIVEQAAPEPEPAMVAQPAAPSRLIRARPPVARAAPGSRDKAAFTLRLDKERHLKLRLACAIEHKSAQQIVSAALDAFLETMPDVSAALPRLSRK